MLLEPLILNMHVCLKTCLQYEYEIKNLGFLDPGLEIIFLTSSLNLLFNFKAIL